MKKVYDVCVKTGEYTDNNGNTRGRFENVGAVMKNDKGSFIMLKRTFNPAGAGDPSRDSVLLSLFEPKQGGGGTANAPATAEQPKPELDDEIPFITSQGTW